MNQQQSQQPKRLTIKEAAALKGCCWQTMKLAIELGQIKSERLGKRTYVVIDDEKETKSTPANIETV